MVIYVDVVFFLNILLDFILLMSVSILLKRNISIKRIIIGSLIGGVSVFILFINVSSIVLFFFKVVLGILMVLITFGYHNIKYTLNNAFYLYTSSFIISGFLYLIKDSGIYNYFVLVFGSLIILFFYLKQMKYFRNNYSNYHKVEVYYHNQIIRLTGFLDTGNKLYDQYRHRPVILIDKNIKYRAEDVIYVPFLSLNNNGVIKCVMVDKIIVDNHSFSNYLVGFSNYKINIDGINCLLHSKMKGEL